MIHGLSQNHVGVIAVPASRQLVLPPPLGPVHTPTLQKWLVIVAASATLSLFLKNKHDNHSPVKALDLPLLHKSLEFRYSQISRTDHTNECPSDFSRLAQIFTIRLRGSTWPYTPSGQYLALYAFGAVLGLAVLIAAAFTARLAAGPLSVAFLGPRLQEDIGARLYYAYDITPMT